MTGQMTPFSGRSGNQPLAGQRLQFGTTAVNTAGQAWAETAVTFDEPFASPPAVVACVAGGSVRHFAALGAITSTSVKVRAMERDGAVVDAIVLISWIAIGV